MTEANQKPVREGLAHKRAAILSAARELFVTDGVERTSMDAVAARARVSKRTVYDYYGDKRRLLLGVIEDSGEAALTTLRQTVDRHLSDPAAFQDTAGLERALTDFAVDLGDSLLTSSGYVAAVKLISENETLLPELDDHPLDMAHVQTVAERLGNFADLGLLDIDDSRLAADHFNALTIQRVLSEHASKRADADHVRQVMADGVHVFMRAYATRPDHGW